MGRKYYEAYDDRYRQVHKEGLQWFYDDPTPIVMETIREFGISSDHAILELGCGEGRDAYPLLKQGYRFLATDISAASIAYAQKKWPEYAECFSVLNCIGAELQETFHLCCGRSAYAGGKGRPGWVLYLYPQASCARWHCSYLHHGRW